MIYLDNAATSLPKPRPVSQAMGEACMRCGNPGRSGHAASLEGGQILYGCRQELAGLLGVADPFCFVYCSNCTDALNQAIKGSLNPGDHVVTTALEHNSVLRPLYTLKERRQISLTVIYPRADGYLQPDDIAKAITDRTRLVVVTHASNVTGAVQPVQAIAAVCARYSVPLLVDGAQTIGSMPVNIEAIGADMVAFPGHKGLLGPQGTGALYIHPRCTPQPLREGGTGSSSLALTQPLDLPDRYESGTAATPAIAGLWAGARHVRRNLDAIARTEDRLTERLWEGLSAVNGVTLYGPPPGKPRVGVVTFNLANKSATDVADRLSEKYNIACRAGLHCAPLAHRFLGTQETGAVRFGIGPFNTSKEIDTAVRAIRELSKEN